MEKKKKKRTPGRPVEINAETRQRVIDYLVKGETLVSASRKIGFSRVSLYRWIKSDPEFAEAVREARAFAAISNVDDMLNIADDDSKDILYEEDGSKRPNTAAVQRSKLRIETRARLGKYYNPELFGERQNIDVTTNGNSIYQGLVITPPNNEDENNNN